MMKSYEWEVNKENFKVLDVSKLYNNFFPAVKKRLQSLEVEEGICILQTFEQKPLISTIEELGYEYLINKESAHVFKLYAYNSGKEFDSKSGLPFKPYALLNYKFIDQELGNLTVDFWDMTWNKKNAAIDLQTKLLLSCANAIGAGRYKQASRELIKGYAIGVTTEKLDELFELIAWNQGVGFFSSEIISCTAFAAYKLCKTREKAGIARPLIVTELLNTFGETNPKVNTDFSQNKKQSCRKKLI